jgi:hypothetical protein
MNATLTTCMLFSILAALAGAIGAIAAGWGLLAAVGLYTLGGSITLLATTAAASLPGAMLRRRMARPDGPAYST